MVVALSTLQMKISPTQRGRLSIGLPLPVLEIDPEGVPAPVDEIVPLGVPAEVELTTTPTVL